MLKLSIKWRLEFWGFMGLEPRSVNNIFSLSGPERPACAPKDPKVYRSSPGGKGELDPVTVTGEGGEGRRANATRQWPKSLKSVFVQTCTRCSSNECSKNHECARHAHKCFDDFTGLMAQTRMRLKSEPRQQKRRSWVIAEGVSIRDAIASSWVPSCAMLISN